MLSLGLQRLETLLDVLQILRGLLLVPGPLDRLLAVLAVITGPTRRLTIAEFMLAAAQIIKAFLTARSVTIVLGASNIDVSLRIDALGASFGMWKSDFLG